MKVILLAVYSVTLFLVRTWAGIGVCALLFAAVAALSRVPARHYFSMLVPVYVIAAFTILFNGFAFDVSAVSQQGGLAGVSAGFMASWPPVALIGSFGLVPAGFARGCFYAVRIILLVVASLVLTYTTTSTELTNALNDFLCPLRVLHVPTDDIAMIFSLALRFIPLTAEELGQVHDAQQARGAKFDADGLVNKLRAWQTVFIPLFVSLFRRADVLACAMDARCYGTPGVTRTCLHDRSVSARSIAVLVGGSVLCIAVAVLF